MKTLLSNAALASSVFVLSSVAAFAQTRDDGQICRYDCGGGGPVDGAVPEIDASTSLLALAALAAAMLFVWERRRRQA